MTDEPSAPTLLDRLARAAVGAPFIVLGAEAAADPGVRVKAAVGLGVPEALGEAAVRFNGAVMALSGLAMALGVRPRAAATALLGSLVPTTLAGHPFWNDTDPVSRNHNRVHFLKNIGLAGAAIAVAVAATRPAARNQVSRSRS